MKYMLSPEELKKAIQDELKASKVVYKHYLEFKYYYEDENGNYQYAGSIYGYMYDSSKTPITISNYEDYIPEFIFGSQIITIENPIEEFYLDDNCHNIFMTGSDIAFTTKSGTNYATDGISVSLNEIIDNIL